MKQIMLIVLALIVSGEIFLRLFLGLGDQVLFVADHRIGYLAKANQKVKRFGNTILYNKYHQRSDDILKNPDYRILVLGDSVTNGGTLTDQKLTITEILEDRLNSELEMTGEVLSASCKSWGIENLYEYIKKFSLFNSDLVILQIGKHDFHQPKASHFAVGGRSHPDKNHISAISELLHRYLAPNIFFSKKSTRSNKSKLGRNEWELRNINSLERIITFAKSKNTPLLILITHNRKDTWKEFQKNPTVEKYQDLIQKNNIETIWVLDEENNFSNHFFKDEVHINIDGNKKIANLLYYKVLTYIKNESK